MSSADKILIRISCYTKLVLLKQFITSLHQQQTIVCCKPGVAGYSNDVFFLLMTLPKLNISCSSCTKKISLLPTMFLDIKQSNAMSFPIIPVYVSLWVGDGDQFLETQSTWIWIIHSMTFHVSLQVDSGDEFLITQSTDIWNVPSMTLHVSLLIVPGYESFTTHSTLI